MRNNFNLICLFLIISHVILPNNSFAGPLENLAKSLETTKQKWIAAGKKTEKAFPIKKIDETKEALLKYSSVLQECKDDKEKADTSCLEFNSPGWKDISNLMGQVGDMAGLSMSGSCSKMADTLGKLQGFQAGFRTQCALFKNACENSCTQAKTMAKKIDSDLNTIASANGAETSTQLDAANPDKIKEYCKKKVERENPPQVPLAADVIGFKQESLITECVNGYNENPTEFVNNLKNDPTKLSTTDSKGKNLDQQIEAAKDQLKDNKGDENSPSFMLKTCNDKDQVIGKTTSNIASLMNSMKKNEACAEQLAAVENKGLDMSNCALTGTCTPTDPATDCVDPKYKDSVYCMNYSDSNGGDLAGATPGSNKSSSLPNFGQSAIGNIDTKGLGLDGLGGDPNNPNGSGSSLGTDGGASSKSAGVPGGSGGSGLSIPGGGYNPNKGGGRSPSGTDAIGPGGFTNSGGGGGYGSSGNKKDDLEKNLPGQEKDPITTKNGIGPEGTTNKMGLTLFQKVTSRYTDLIKGNFPIP